MDIQWIPSFSVSTDCFVNFNRDHGAVLGQALQCCRIRFVSFAPSIIQSEGGRTPTDRCDHQCAAAQAFLAIDASGPQAPGAPARSQLVSRNVYLVGCTVAHTKAVIWPARSFVREIKELRAAPRAAAPGRRRSSHLPQSQITDSL
ncbi:hypothetical protein EVAR_48484_1 [Eumeta japonica]|uniref:Uncharacterized protein n=1 Tax=Eumeta variegata TaxID=151549 RepID=A0A4C1XEG2_EUMVA|nr:hypothetical protein EVAR_48484_1 [Eumeta japonica]